MMSRLLFQLEDHFRFLAEQGEGVPARVVFGILSGVFAFAGDVLHACRSGLRPL